MTRKSPNPITIMADNVYDEKDAHALEEHNLYPLIIKSKQATPRKSIKGNSYYLFSSDNYAYSFLDVFEFLSKNKDVHIILSGTENKTINYGKLVDGEFILHTDDDKLLLTHILSDTMSEYSSKNIKETGKKFGLISRK